MKKHLFLIAVALLVFVPVKVMAANDPVTLAQTDFNNNTNGVTCDASECTLDEGSYKLDDDIDLGAKQLHITENVTLDLNENDISSTGNAILVDSTANVTITGNGSVIAGAYNNPLLVAEQANVTIENGVFEGSNIVVQDTAKLTVNGGEIGILLAAGESTVVVNGGSIAELDAQEKSNVTVNAGNVGDFYIEGVNEETIPTAVINNGEIGHVITTLGNLTINNGTFNGVGNDCVSIFGNSEVTIKGGTFTSNAFGAVVVEGDIKSLKISGGTFKGPMVGLAFNSGNEVELTGGKFEATHATEGLGAIICFSSEDTTILARILGDNYTYNPTLDSKTKDWYGQNLVYSQAKIEVVSTLDGTPSTLDNISTYVSIAIIATLGLFGTVILTKRTIKAN